MKPIYRLALLGLLPLALAACESLPKPETAQAPPGPLPFDEPTPSDTPLDSDLVYSYLVADVAAQRGELPLAYSHYMHTARIARDPRAAERATRIAVYLKQLDDAMAAARRWVQLAPNSPDARMSLALLLDRNGDREAALVELEALLRIADALGHDGYLQIAQVLAKENGSDPLGLMQALVDAYPDEAGAYYGLGVVALSQAAFDKAQLALEQALALKPGWPQAQVLLARSRMAQGDKVAALAGLDAAVAAQPDDTLLRSSRARLRVDLGDHAGALDDFRRLLRAEPDNGDYLYATGMLATQTRDWPTARDVWQRLRSQGGDHFSEATYFLAQVEEQSGHPDVAAGLYAGVASGSLQVDAGLRLASLEAKEGKFDQARSRLQQLRRDFPDRAVDSLMAEARLLREAGKPQQAAQLLDQAVAARPDDIELRYGRAMQSARRDDLAAMERDLRYVLSVQPDHVDALNALGYSLADHGIRLDEAETLISRALTLNPDSPAILDSMGWLRYRQGRYAEAIDYLRRAFDHLADPEIAAHLGEVLWVTGDRQGARTVWRKALKETPDSEILHAVMRRLE